MIPVPSLDCVRLVKHFESYRARAYRDAVGVITVGYGSTYRPDGSRVQITDALSEEAASEWLALDLAAISAALEKQLPGVTLAQCECDAICSLVYNIGAGAFGKSAIKRALLNGDRPSAADGFLSWTKAGGKVFPGLLRRRTTERAVFRGSTLKQAYLDGYAAIGKKAAKVPEDFAA